MGRGSRCVVRVGGDLPAAVRPDAAPCHPGARGTSGGDAPHRREPGSAPLSERVAGSGRVAADGVVGAGPRPPALPARPARPPRRRGTCHAAGPRAGARPPPRPLGTLAGAGGGGAVLVVSTGVAGT